MGDIGFYVRVLGLFHLIGIILLQQLTTGESGLLLGFCACALVSGSDDDYLVVSSADDYNGEETDCPDVFDPEIFFSGRDVPLGTPHRAFRTVPRGFVIRQSAIPGAGLGVFAETFIRKNTWLGEYEGEFKTVEEADIGDNSYAWKMTKDDVEHHHVDAIDERLSNWLRFINCSRHSSEESVVPCMCYGKMYYVTSQDILPGTELKVYYGDDYADDLGIAVVFYNKPWARRGFSIKGNISTGSS